MGVCVRTLGRRFIGIVALTCAACGLSVVGVAPLSDGADSGVTVDGGLPNDASANQDSGLDARPDSSSLDGAPGDDDDAGPVTIAPAGTVAAPTGNAQQTHLVHAENAKRWWLFTIASGAPTVLQSFSSTDFVIWKQAADLALPKAHKGVGANFSVAYASINGHDLVHLGIGLAGTGDERTHFHGRAEVKEAISWSALSGVSTVNDDQLGDPEGAVTVVSASGRVSDFTGWAPYEGGATSTGNQDLFVSQATDDGSPWTSGFGGRIDIGAAQQTINARAAVSLGGEAMMAIWESADTPEPDPSTIRISRTKTGGWTDPVSIFPDARFGVNDWGATALSGNDVHVVRRASGFEHARFNGTGWIDGEPIQTLPGGGKKNAGLVVLHVEARVFVAAIAHDSSVAMTVWSGGNAPLWTAWAPVVTAPSAGIARSSLSGWRSPSAGVGLVWTEVEGGQSRVAGRRLKP